MSCLKLKYTLFLCVFIALPNALASQSKKHFKIHAIAFYNVENMFDTINDPNHYDENSPIMALKVNKTIAYKNKIANISKVIAAIGKDKTQNAPAIIGLAEVENKLVINDLIHHPNLRSYNYNSIHYNSSDTRGIDVALIYQSKTFTPLHHKVYELKLYDPQNKTRIYTRDQLVVTGLLDHEKVHVLVNHWPSRRGGVKKSDPKRIKAAQLAKHIIDSLYNSNPYAKIIMMGDFNDNPTNKSFKSILKTSATRSKTQLKRLFNPMYTMFKDGFGSAAYRDQWSLFDQIIVSSALLNKNDKGYQFYKAGIFNPDYLITRHGKYKGYPFRSYANGLFTNGYSDHFAVYAYLIKAID